MKVPISWLKNYINVDEDNIDDLLHRLTLAGTEVESIETQGNWEGVVVGQVLEVSKHPNADRLNLVKVNSGENETLDVVCGANNLYAGQKVAFAPVGSKLFSPKSKKMETLKKSKIRGEISNGMICSALELGLGEDHEGILDLNKDFENGKSLKDYYSDTIIDFELTPNRPDCLGIYGVAREVSAVTGSKLKNVQTYNKNSNNISDNLEIDIESKDLCKRYMGVVIDGVEITDSPEWLKSALISIGENPINNIVDITNYVMFELGQPLHAFDYKKINNNKIVVRNAKKGERLITLDEENRELNEDMLVIADSDFPVALAGIKGGKESGIQSDTSKIVLESACFEGGNNRKTANHFDLKSQATLRFEKNLKPELCEVAFNRAIHLILEVCGGKISSEIVDTGFDKEDKAIEISLSKINSLLGFHFEAKSVDQIISFQLECPYGLAECVSATTSTFGTTVELAKQNIGINTTTIFKRFEWIKRNRDEENLTAHNLNFNYKNTLIMSYTAKYSSSFYGPFRHAVGSSNNFGDKDKSPVIIEYLACLKSLFSTLLLGSMVIESMGSEGGVLNKLSLPNLENPNSSRASAIGTIPPSKYCE